MKEVTYPPEFPKVPPTIEAHLHHPHGTPSFDIPAEETDAGGSQWSSDAASLKSSKSTNPPRQPPLDRGGSSVKSGAGDSGFLSVGGGDKKMAASAEDVSRLGEGLEQLNMEVKEELDDPEDFQDAEDGKDEDGVRVVFLTEQISHHPPASDYYFTAPEKGVEAFGVDQISAKVSGTSGWHSFHSGQWLRLGCFDASLFAAVRITPGSMNKGIFISITSGHGAGEEYHVTHAAAHVNGILRGNFYATMTDSVRDGPFCSR